MVTISKVMHAPPAGFAPHSVSANPCKRNWASCSGLCCRSVVCKPGRERVPAFAIHGRLSIDLVLMIRMLIVD
jgi:hypothetical protein